MAILEGVRSERLGLMAEWCPFAVQHLGPSSKFGGYAVGNTGPKRGEVKHSAVGFMPGLLSGLADPNVKKSWHFSIAYDGTIYQHYSVSSHCWHAGDSDGDGGVAANIDLVGIEHEGGAPGNLSEPLREAQIAATVRLTEWLAAGRSVRRYPNQLGVWTMAEHNQVSDLPTACPSGRIPWTEILRRLTPLPVPVPEPIPQPPPLTEIDFLRAFASAGQFSRMGWNPQDLADLDKRAIRDFAIKMA